ncbi:hypothetical protein N7467_009483 [Penicillium canescens]|nr:hypothetical protein N7467_009483 [Penicillium canescens]
MATLCAPTSSKFLGNLKYLRRDPKYEIEKPFSCLIDLTKVPGAEQTNIVSDIFKDITIHDGRECRQKLGLDTTGFELIDFNDQFLETSFEDTNWLKTVYYPFIENMVVQALGAKEAHVFEHQLRYRHPGFGRPFTRGALHYDPPINQVHVVHDFFRIASVDATQPAGKVRFEKQWPNYSEELWNDRLRIINIWRPLVPVVTEWPLVLCDFQSVDLEKDLRASDVITRNYIGESFAAHYSPNHRWFSVRDQRFSEGWMIKIYDSKPGVAHTVLHTAIDVGPSTQARKSCEIRVLVRG